jgi:DNA-binding CsgD family transcriptional regulator
MRARAMAARVLPQAAAHIERSAIAPSLGARQEAELHLATARAHAERVRGHVDPATWDGLATAWGARPMPYLEAKARWWQALAVLGSAREDDREAARQAARAPLSQAYHIARRLPAMPLLREVVDLAARARVALPVVAEPSAVMGIPVGPDGAAADHDLVAVGPGRAPGWVAVGPGRPRVSAVGRSELAQAIEQRVIAVLRKRPADAYGLSPREQEVLDILAEGRTDRDIASRLFISERTVHVHVRRILAKLGVSSRTEAAGVAIRQGLVPPEMPERTVTSSAPSRERMP